MRLPLRVPFCQDNLVLCKVFFVMQIVEKGFVKNMLLDKKEGPRLVGITTAKNGGIGNFA